MAYVTSSTDLGYEAGTTKKSFFARVFDRIVSARMQEADRYIDSYLRNLPECDRRRIEDEIYAAERRSVR